jgi:hypothetical protein
VGWKDEFDEYADQLKRIEVFEDYFTSRVNLTAEVFLSLSLLCLSLSLSFVPLFSYYAMDQNFLIKLNNNFFQNLKPLITHDSIPNSKKKDNEALSSVLVDINAQEDDYEQTDVTEFSYN